MASFPLHVTFEQPLTSVSPTSWDGDGACDIIYADPVQGHVEVWLNQIKNTGKLEFSQVSGEAAPGVSCDQPRGRGQFDVAVRFADVT